MRGFIGFNLIFIISMYREFSPYANFISANFITAIFKTFLKYLANGDFYMFLANAIIWLMRFYVLFISLLRSLAKNVPNAIFGKCDFFQVPKVA
jgi:hypothetical protein